MLNAFERREEVQKNLVETTDTWSKCRAGFFSKRTKNIVVFKITTTALDGWSLLTRACSQVQQNVGLVKHSPSRIRCKYVVSPQITPHFKFWTVNNWISESHLEVWRLHPWHETVNEGSEVLAIGGVVRLTQVIDDLLADGQLLLRVRRGQMQSKVVQTAHGCCFTNHYRYFKNHFTLFLWCHLVSSILTRGRAKFTSLAFAATLSRSSLFWKEKWKRKVRIWNCQGNLKNLQSRQLRDKDNWSSLEQCKSKVNKDHDQACQEGLWDICTTFNQWAFWLNHLSAGLRFHRLDCAQKNWPGLGHMGLTFWVFNSISASHSQVESNLTRGQWKLARVSSKRDQTRGSNLENFKDKSADLQWFHRAISFENIGAAAIPPFTCVHWKKISRLKWQLTPYF